MVVCLKEDFIGGFLVFVKIGLWKFESEGEVFVLLWFFLGRRGFELRWVFSFFRLRFFFLGIFRFVWG